MDSLDEVLGDSDAAEGVCDVDEVVEEVGEVEIFVRDEFGISRAVAVIDEVDEGFEDADADLVLEGPESIEQLGSEWVDMGVVGLVSTCSSRLMFEMLEIPGISSFGLDRASATTLALPCTYRISVVYSAIQDNEYLCLAV